MSINKINLFRIFLQFHLSILTLTSCITMIPNDINNFYTLSQWNIHQKIIHQLKQYKAYGSFIYISKNKKIYSRFFLQQYSPKNYRLIITNLLGDIEIDINVLENKIKLINYKNKYYYYNAEKIFKKLTGITIPLNTLHQWIIGLPNESKKFIINNQYYFVNKFIYQKNNLIWIINYLEYDHKIKPKLPKKIEILQNNEYIKIKINNWILK
ncbi:Outer-membrane lipoprotein LolB [Serratia symbiotica]|nr:Outer-membrane lipoprotein LolB [Serratia symbiotica]